MKIDKIINEEKNSLLIINADDLKEYSISLIQQAKENFIKEAIKNNKEEYYTTNEVCRLLKVDRATLVRWRKIKLLIPRTIGRQNRYLKSEISSLIEGKQYITK